MTKLCCICAILLLSFQAWAADDKKPEEKKPVVFIQKIKTVDLSETLLYPGRVEPRVKTAIVAEIDGVVTKVSAPLGTKVQRRSPVLVLRNADPVYQYAPMVVTSPVAGVVSRVEVSEGSRVARGDKLVAVTDPAQLQVLVEVTAGDLGSIKTGQAAELTVPGKVDQPIQLKVKGLSPIVDPATGTALCELTAADGQALPPAGSLGRVSFRVNERKGISIPVSALKYRGKDVFAHVVKDKKAKMVPVTVGRNESGTVEIVKGLKEGDEIVERASAYIADGTEVEIKRNDAEKQEAM